MEPEVYDEMFALEERHWWFRARRRIVLHLLRRFVTHTNGRRPRLADLGCGCGANLAAFRDHYDAWGADANAAAAAYARHRVGPRICLAELPSSIPFAPASFDAVVMTDVLEHIENDRASAATAVDLLRPGGVFIATVPAGQWLYARRDAAHHHKRRYSRRALASLMDGLPARVELLSFCNTFLFPPAAAVRVASRLLPSHQSTDLKVPPGPMNKALEALYATERHVLGRFPLPVGLSLILVARRLDSSPG
ncbi:MAG TPA: methyltransferase domain-containing protein [Phycisphaerae bacterium]|nr:methyltransferase domain-containing protein [Phycisphaerae bacterium]